MLFRTSHNIIIALISFICGLFLPHFIIFFQQHGEDSLASLLWITKIWKSKTNIHHDSSKQSPWSHSSSSSTSSLPLLPLYQYQNKAQYQVAVQQRRELASRSHNDSNDDNPEMNTTSIPSLSSQQYPCTKERLLDFLHTNTTVHGYHVLCFTPNPLDQQEYKLTIYRLGILEENDDNKNTKKNNIRYTYTTTIVPHQLTWLQFQSDIISNQIMTLRKKRPRTTKRQQQPYALFTIDGQRILDEASIEVNDNDPWFVNILAEEMGMILFYEGGQFVWPGIHVGYERHIALYNIMPIHSPNMDHKSPVNVTLVTLSLSPLVLSVHGFLSVEECQHIQHRATPTMEYSEVVLMDHDAGRPASDFRTSQTTFLDADHDDSMLIDIDYRTASLIRIPRNHQEPVQVLRYGITEKYSSHHDYFHPNSYKNDPDTLELIQHGIRNRFVTVFWYLSTVIEGGETIFPRAFGQYEKNSNDCTTGLKVRPELGKVILFYNMKMDGTTDPQSLHGACPVKQGIKWAANKWVWNEPMDYVPM